MRANSSGWMFTDPESGTATSDAPAAAGTILDARLGQRALQQCLGRRRRSRRLLLDSQRGKIGSAAIVTACCCCFDNSIMLKNYTRIYIRKSGKALNQPTDSSSNTQIQNGKKRDTLHNFIFHIIALQKTTIIHVFSCFFKFILKNDLL